MSSIQDFLNRSAVLLPDSDSARLDVEILLAHVLDKEKAFLYAHPEYILSSEENDQLHDLLSRRVQGEPIAYITGEKEFWSLHLKVNSHTLIPRPETELLVEKALNLSLDAHAKVLDLGTGSGAIALALAVQRANWRVTGVDVDPECIAVARFNAIKHGQEQIHWICSNWCNDVQETGFDLIVSNPPYIKRGDPHLAVGDVRFEPERALISGDDGLVALTSIIEQAAEKLMPGGWLLLEHGYTQAEAVRKLLHDRGYLAIDSERDLAGFERITSGKRPD
jgi:release factor glutamine methyltransferase